MLQFLLAAFVLAVVYVAARYYVHANLKNLTVFVRQLAGVMLCVGAAVVLFSGRYALLALPLGLAGVAVLTGKGWSPFGRRSRAFKGGKSSAVRTSYFDMELDHASGAMDGTIKRGSFKNRLLSSLDTEELQALYGDLRSQQNLDADSLSLFETYLDSVIASWREDFQHHDFAGHDAATGTSPITEQEAYEILGLAPGADISAIKAAHRRLMLKAHPDRGGSTFLAAKINEAKDILLGNHSSNS